MPPPPIILILSVYKSNEVYRVTPSPIPLILGFMCSAHSCHNEREYQHHQKE